MASTTQSLANLITLLLTFSCFFLAFGENLPASTISAAPALLPDPISPSSSSSSSSSPALSPDIYPVFPSPGGSELAPTDSSAPLIPSSPSPPNPDAFAAPEPGEAFPPEGVLQDSSSQGLSMEVLLSSTMVVICGFWLNEVA